MCYNQLWRKAYTSIYNKIVAVAACLLCGCFADISFDHSHYCLASVLHIHSTVVVFGPLPSALPNEAAPIGRCNVSDLRYVHVVCICTDFRAVLCDAEVSLQLSLSMLPLPLSFSYFVMYTQAAHVFLPLTHIEMQLYTFHSHLLSVLYILFSVISVSHRRS